MKSKACVIKAKQMSNIALYNKKKSSQNRKLRRYPIVFKESFPNAVR